MLSIIKDQDTKLDIIELSNDKMLVHVCTFGCTITKMQSRDKNNKMCDVVLAFKDVKEYLKRDGSYLGALVGRCCNRIAKGKFKLNGQKYQLAINNGPNSLHGGINGFSYQVFDYQIIDDNTVCFSYLAKDNEEAYPGNLNLKVFYKLLEDGLEISYEAISDQDTIVNLTNHSYFNLSGKAQSVEDHYLKVKASKYGHVDHDGLFNGEFENVDGTAFDLRESSLISDKLNRDDEQLKIAKGFDHHFCFDSDFDQVELYSKTSGIVLRVSTSLPGAQIYSANYLDNPNGLNNQVLKPRQAICIETQYLPDSINQEANPAVILRKNEKYFAKTSYRFEVKHEY